VALRRDLPHQAHRTGTHGEGLVEPPLEGLWWADDIQDFICGKRDKLNWRMMIVYEPDWLTPEMFANRSRRRRRGWASHQQACGSNAMPKA
jgi:hypothetical protein